MPFSQVNTEVYQTASDSYWQFVLLLVITGVIYLSSVVCLFLIYQRLITDIDEVDRSQCRLYLYGSRCLALRWYTICELDSLCYAVCAITESGVRLATTSHLWQKNALSKVCTSIQYSKCFAGRTRSRDSLMARQSSKSRSYVCQGRWHQANGKPSMTAVFLTLTLLKPCTFSLIWKLMAGRLGKQFIRL